MKRYLSLLLCVILALTLLCGCKDLTEKPSAPSAEESFPSETESSENSNQSTESLFGGGQINLEAIPPYSGSPYYKISDKPSFSKEELTTEGFEFYGDLDNLKRCTSTVACVGKETMPTEPRGEIGMIKPTGWQISKYDSVDGKYLYNRCHLIGFQLTGENANEKNLITGTRYMNVQGMLPFENQIAEYVDSTGNHVLYRVTPIYEGNNLVAHGVHMEAISVEDNGKGVCFDVFCYNVQPRIAIDYANGDNEYAGIDDYEIEGETTFVLNTSTKKFHRPSCSSVESMKEENRKTTSKTSSVLISEGYSPCGNCNP